MIALKVGRLTPLQDISVVPYNGKVLCKCDCGNVKSILKSSVVSGRTISCGCYHKEVMQNKMTTHGMKGTPIYGVYRTMLSRCYLPSQQSYYLYGGRGIKVCEEWKSSFEKFYADMGDVPFKGAQIDRIDTDGDYTANNCQWVTSQENSLNKRNTIYLTSQGVTKTLHQWATEMGISRLTLMSRRCYGWSDEQIVTTPVQQHKLYTPRRRGVDL